MKIILINERNNNENNEKQCKIIMTMYVKDNNNQQ